MLEGSAPPKCLRPTTAAHLGGEGCPQRAGLHPAGGAIMSWWTLGLLQDLRQANIRTADNHKRSPPPPSPQTKVTIVGKNEIYNRENPIGPFLVHNVFRSQTPPPSPLS